MKQNMLQLKSIAICSLVMLLLCFSFDVKATTISQPQQTVSGTVTTAADGMPLPGVTVVVKGTSNGTTTDFDGNYELEVAADAVLSFSYVGMKTIDIPVDGQSTINAQLQEDLGVLDEIVVVGYGSQKKSDVTGSVASVPEERLENLPVTNVTQAIQGTTAGLNISQGSSVPGSTGSIQVRG
ncbi:MAG TPA: SusC/RagA family TonB-linked outer membrane protein, partial [Leeuwenhoekiella sp.]|nr:SusC/RagA family TonB-linked outer membrane protein [Leeuwenhoekiella sp.]